VVTDAETGLREQVRDYFPGARHQLCEWHVPYTMKHMLCVEGMPLAERTELAGTLSGILTRGGREGRAAYNRLQRRLKGYRRAWRLLENARPYILDEDRSALRTTSLAERAMRELNRRTDVGVRWSVPGVGNLLKLRLAKRYNPDDYERVWRPPRTVDATLVSQC
jgi:transposase-like protein